MSHKLPRFSADQLLQSLSLLPPASSWLVGLSGGADSTALLYAMVQARKQLSAPLRAVHINHGLHPDASQWQQHCESQCLEWSVPLISINVQIEGSGRGLEAEAREKRYAAIAELMQPGEALLTAHHADDQAETLLLNLMRGSGVDGLSAMPVEKTFGQHRLIRPLLNVHHQALLAFLEFHGINWVEDPSNQHINQDRNFIRNKVTPLLESRFAGTVKRLLLTQQSMAETRLLLAPLANQHLQAGWLHPLVFEVSDELLENPALFKLVIREWLKREATPGIPNRKLNELLSQLQQLTTGGQPSVNWADAGLRFYQNRLWLQQGADTEVCANIEWPANDPTVFLGQDLGTLSFTMDESSTSLKPPGKMTITNRSNRPGLALMRGEHHQSLKNLFQSASIPVWLRDSVPLILIDDELAAVGDWALGKTFASWLSENHVKFTWQPNAPTLQYLVQNQHQAQQS